MVLVARCVLAVVLATVLLPVPSAASSRCGADVPGLERRWVDVGAVRLHVATGGPPGAPAVVLLHGVPETWRTWRTVALDLAADHRVVVPDLRGAGCSDPGAVRDPDATTLAADLAGLTTALGLPPAVVVGHDMGAMPAYAWARDRPDQVRRLVLSGGGVPGRGLEELAPPHVAAFAAAPPGALAAAVAGREREVLRAFVGDPAVEASGSLDDAVRAYSAPGRYDAAIGRYRALARDAARNRADPRPLAVPATALEGGAPGISAATLPGADVVVVPGAGHYLQEDRPRATAAAIRALAALRPMRLRP
ncbi:alpha/beta fold hydrolase [Actinomycetospora termitidis]|uniref:Alpha/beta hydrolase n=1 Tax=Actinomycetospora termitidis TaxID=3053470 RepID=A0ABT7M6S7_9PSEU|nr:alpha/beta hydrolase [Actinomycetospora sp. Odt1-22]MDL5155939.1 alpha/beta hydrolase [Actinomycetospora sp. Odt1-22]